MRDLKPELRRASRLEDRQGAFVLVHLVENGRSKAQLDPIELALPITKSVCSFTRRAQPFPVTRSPGGTMGSGGSVVKEPDPKGAPRRRVPHWKILGEPPGEPPGESPSTSAAPSAPSSGNSKLAL